MHSAFTIYAVSFFDKRIIYDAIIRILSIYCIKSHDIMNIHAMELYTQSRYDNRDPFAYMLSSSSTATTTTTPQTKCRSLSIECKARYGYTIPNTNTYAFAYICTDILRNFTGERAAFKVNASYKLTYITENTFWHFKNQKYVKKQHLHLWYGALTFRAARCQVTPRSMSAFTLYILKPTSTNLFAPNAQLSIAMEIFLNSFAS